MAAPETSALFIHNGVILSQLRGKCKLKPPKHYLEEDNRLTSLSPFRDNVHLANPLYPA